MYASLHCYFPTQTKPSAPLHHRHSLPFPVLLILFLFYFIFIYLFYFWRSSYLSAQILKVILLLTKRWVNLLEFSFISGVITSTKHDCLACTVLKYQNSLLFQFNLEFHILITSDPNLILAEDQSWNPDLCEC